MQNYLETADEKKIRAIYIMVEDEINKQHSYTLTEEEITFLDEERQAHVEENTKSYSWDEAKSIIRDKNSS